MTPSAYETTLTGAGFYPAASPGLLRLAGEGRLAFVQRQSTNDIQRLRPDTALDTVMTTPAARILDLLCLFGEGDMLVALTLPGHAGQTARYLQSRIFFMDQVTVEDASAQFAQIELFGPTADEILKQSGVSEIPAPEGLWRGELAGVGAFVIGRRATFGSKFRLVLPVESLAAMEAGLLELGAAALTPEEYHILRVEDGQPAAGAELTEEYTPLETGLEAAISHSKGCYTGQEIIARQTNFDKVTRHLVGLKLAGVAPSGSKVRAEDQPAGVLTSSAYSPRFGPIALAIIRRPFHTVGGQVAIETDRGAIQAVVAALPFSEPG